MATTEKVIFQLQADTKQALREIREMKGQLDGTAKSVKNVSKETSTMNKMMVQAAGAMAGLFSVQAVSQFIRKIIDVRAEFEKYEAILRVSLGTQAKAAQAMADLVKFASQTPFALNELTGAFVKLTNYGLRPSMDEMRKLGDLASSVGKGFDQLAEAIADATTGEMERLKEFGIKAKQSGDIVSFTFKGVTTEVDRTSDAIRDYIVSLGDMEGVSGSMAEIAETLGGKISNLGDAFDKLLNTIGEDSGPILKGFFDTLIFGTEQAELKVKRGSAVRSLLGPIWKGLFGDRDEAKRDAQEAAMSVSSAYASTILNVMQRLGIKSIFGFDQSELEALSIGMSEEAKVIIDIQKDLWANLEAAREKAAKDAEQKRLENEKAAAEKEAAIKKGEQDRYKEFIKRREDEFNEIAKENAKERVAILEQEELDPKLAAMDRHAENRKEREEQNEQDIIDLKRDGAFENVELLNFLAKTSANITEEGSALHKATSTTATLINTVEAAMAAYKWAAAFSGPIGGAIAAASALAFGFAQVKRIQSYAEGGFTGKSNTGFSDRHGKIAGYVHEDEFVFNKEKTKALRPFLEDIHNDRLNVKDLAMLTRRGMIHQLVKNEFKSEILEREVNRIYRKMGENQPIFYDDNNLKIRGNTIYRKR